MNQRKSSSNRIRIYLILYQLFTSKMAIHSNFSTSTIMKDSSYDNVSATTSPQSKTATLYSKIQTAMMTRTITEDYFNLDYVYTDHGNVSYKHNSSYNRLNTVNVDQQWYWDVNKRIKVGFLLSFLLVIITVCQNVCAKRLYQS